MSDKIQYKYGIIGMGAVGNWLKRNFLIKKIFENGKLVLTNRIELNYFTSNKEKDNNIEVIRNSDIIFLCIKPQDLKSIQPMLKEELKDKEKTLVSAVTAIPIEYYEENITKRIIRVSPNISQDVIPETYTGDFRPMLISFGDYFKRESGLSISGKHIRSILGQISEVYEIKDDEMNDYNLLSSCSTSIITYFIQKYINALDNVSPDLAKKIMINTMLKIDYSIKKGTNINKQFCTKKGITQEGINIIDKSNIAKSIVNALENRTNEIVKLYGNLTS